MAKNTDHVIWDNEARPSITFAPENQFVLRCDHCGDRFVLGLPLSVSMMGVIVRQYTREHRYCKAPKEPLPIGVSPDGVMDKNVTP